MPQRSIKITSEWVPVFWVSLVFSINIATCISKRAPFYISKIYFTFDIEFYELSIPHSPAFEPALHPNLRNESRSNSLRKWTAEGEHIQSSAHTTNINREWIERQSNEWGKATQMASQQRVLENQDKTRISLKQDTTQRLTLITLLMGYIVP